MGKYPVISISLKGINAATYEDAFDFAVRIMKKVARNVQFLLEKHYDSKVILLIDEYDVPLAKAFENGYYDQMVFLIRNLLEQVLKTNSGL